MDLAVLGHGPPSARNRAALAGNYCSVANHARRHIWVSRDQMMAGTRPTYPSRLCAFGARADLALYTKAALAAELGLIVCLCGTKADGSAF